MNLPDSVICNRSIKALIIDEADRILEVGFEDEVSFFQSHPFELHLESSAQQFTSNSAA